MTASPPSGADSDGHVPGSTPQAVLSMLLQLPAEEWWSGDNALLAVELFRLLEEAPEVLATALLQEVRAGRAARVDLALSQVGHLDCVPLVGAAATLDPGTAHRWAARLSIDLHGCIQALGRQGALAVVRDRFAGMHPDDGEWLAKSREDFWLLPAERIWEALFRADDRPVHPGDQPDLRSWLLAGAPRVLFAPDPPRRELTSEESALLDAHIEGFIAQVEAAVSTGSDPDWWMRSVAVALDPCGLPTCCRPSHFRAAMEERGWFLYVGRGPWTSWR